jgi:Domain of unknown function (DUF3854)
VINGSAYGSGLYEHHAKQLKASKISAERAQARGYRSIDGGNRKRLDEIGVTKDGRGDGMLIPLLRLDGSVGGYQHRPDNPRVKVNKDGEPREVKYETPWRQPNMIDFPPGVAERLQDRSAARWITEGVKKGDAGADAGLCIVDIVGVWNWVGKGGVPLPDFRDLGPLPELEVILCFDSDSHTKPEVRQALKELAGWLKIKAPESGSACSHTTATRRSGLTITSPPGRQSTSCKRWSETTYLCSTAKDRNQQQRHNCHCLSPSQSSRRTRFSGAGSVPNMTSTRST